MSKNKNADLFHGGIFFFSLLIGVGFLTVSADAAVSCTNATHEADRTLSGAGTLTLGSDFDFGNCGSPAGAGATTGAYENAKFLNLATGKYHISTTAQYGNSSDEHILVVTSDGSAATVLDLNGSNPGPATLSGSATVDLCIANGSITVRAYSQTKPAVWDFHGISASATRIGNATCGQPVGSLQCIVYGIEKAGTRDTQIFTYNPVTSSLRYGTLFDKLQLRGMAIHPVTNVVYAGAGVSSSDTQNGVRGIPGGLYWINPITRNPVLLGATGMTAINGLAFRPNDNTLWAIAEKDGIYTIDLATLTSQKKLSTSENVDGLAWNASGTLLYVKKSYHLYEYNPTTNKMSRIVAYTFVTPQDTVDGQGALGTRPDGDLMVPTGNGTGLYRYNPVTKTVIASGPMDSKVRRIEGLDWPFMCPNAPPSGVVVTLPPPPSETPETPTVTATPQCSAGRIVLSWTDDPNATDYHAYHCTGTSCTPTVEQGTSAGTPYADSSVANDAAVHRYRVRGHNHSGGGFSDYSNTVQGVCPPLPINVTLTASIKKVPTGDQTTLSWTSSGADTCTLKDSNGTTLSALCNGSMAVTITAHTVYTVRATNAGGTVKATETVDILPKFEEL